MNDFRSCLKRRLGIEHATELEIERIDVLNVYLGTSHCESVDSDSNHLNYQSNPILYYAHASTRIGFNPLKTRDKARRCLNCA